MNKELNEVQAMGDNYGFKEAPVEQRESRRKHTSYLIDAMLNLTTQLYTVTANGDQDAQEALEDQIGALRTAILEEVAA